MKHRKTNQILAAILFAALCSCAGDALTAHQNPTTIPPNHNEWKVKTVMEGKASWYSVKTNYGTRTASGERLRNDAYTAAHKTLPMGTHVRVTNTSNGKSEILRITDRGPYTRGRILDVTVGCAHRLGFYSRGIAPVKVEVLQSR